MESGIRSDVTPKDVRKLLANDGYGDIFDKATGKVSETRKRIFLNNLESLGLTAKSTMKDWIETLVKMIENKNM